MIDLRRFSLSLVAILAIAGSCFASGITGKWLGRFQIDMSANKKITPKMQSAINKQMAKQIYSLVLKRDRTFTAEAVGKRGVVRKSGTWTLSGSTLSLYNKDKQGVKRLTFNTPFTVSADHRKLQSKTMYGQTLTFTRS